MSTTNARVTYSGSVFWLIFWAVIFFPVALTLLITGGEFSLDGATYSIRYSGSRGWLCFWEILFFPVALILLALNGFTVTTKHQHPISET
jgi:hypothetical protein